jgi:hypothetical protein
MNRVFAPNRRQQQTWPEWTNSYHLTIHGEPVSYLLVGGASQVQLFLCGNEPIWLAHNKKKSWNYGDSQT